MSRIELIVDTDCPNAEKARARLREALATAGLPARWAEWNRSDPAAPAHARRYGSPTILVNGKDVAGEPPGTGSASCRVYRDPTGAIVTEPPAELILSRLAPGRTWPSRLAVLPGIGASFLPAGACPACWPAYAGVLSSLGIAPLLTTAYLLPLTAALFGAALTSLAYRAKSRRGYRPLGMGALGAALALTGKFALSSDAALYAGLALLLAASVWNSWPPKVASAGSCPACADRAGPVTMPHAHRRKSP